MITQRLRGLVTLHVFVTAAIVTSYFLAMALAVPYLPVLELGESVNLLLYALPIMIGILISARFWSEFVSRFHAISWSDAASISSRQILVVALLIFGLMAATKDRTVSRLFLAAYLASCSLLLLIVNRFVPGLLARMVFGRSHRIPTLFVGSFRTLARLDAWIGQQKHLGISVVGTLSDDEPPMGAHVAGPWLGRTELLEKTVREKEVGQVILLELPPNATETRTVVEICQSAGSRLLIYQDFWDRLPIPMNPVIESKHLFLTVHDEPLEDPMNRAIKRIFDIVVSFPVVLLILPPLNLMVWAVQWVQARGPLYLKRNRGGQRGREFVMLKYRSMYAANPDDNLEAQQARRGDARIYPFGAFLRTTSLDEFPQFWNVLVGDMSIVGPRPHLPRHDTEFSLLAKTYRTRQLVKPGITGLAQVSGYRGEISDEAMLHRRVQLDIHYITHWSVWLDVEITFKTVWHVLFPPKSAV